MVEGGVVQAVCSDNPKALKNVKVFVLDYDVEGADEDDLTYVRQDDGSFDRVNLFQESVTQSSVKILESYWYVVDRHGNVIDDGPYANFSDAQDAAEGKGYPHSNDCAHSVTENCLICHECGRCSESLDEQDICSECRK